MPDPTPTPMLAAPAREANGLATSGFVVSLIGAVAVNDAVDTLNSIN